MDPAFVLPEFYPGAANAKSAPDFVLDGRCGVNA
jgi:hypothetical protein